MSADEIQQDSPVTRPDDAPTSPRLPAEPEAKKRPRLNLNPEGARERKRGKSMFGLVLGTLNKAKIEDKERNASEAAKKRQLIEQRLQHKLRRETDSVRRAEEAKKDKVSANRREEDLQLKDSIQKLRRRQLPLLANFLLTSDNIVDEPLDTPITNPLALPTRSHPPPLYYLPAILTPAQDAFLKRRKVQVTEASEAEWDQFKQERSNGIEDIKKLRERVAEEEERKKAEKEQEKDSNVDEDTAMDEVGDSSSRAVPTNTGDTAMEGIEEDGKKATDEPEATKKGESTPMQGDDGEAVEY